MREQVEAVQTIASNPLFVEAHLRKDAEPLAIHVG